MKNIFKLSILVLAVALFGIESAEAQKTKLKYVDAKTLNIINKIDNDCAPFSRINSEKYEARKSLGRTSTGVAILFRTNSRRGKHDFGTSRLGASLDSGTRNAVTVTNDDNLLAS